ncbi:AMP-binding protein [Amycolatopsis mongoliensis]|uniref:AMP-binding protein n=1 Tax=Amycolatopsis mongoliensis TaxID=715475 RepID=A0A9Y2JK67_9PSEU|nr:AMP-binding protein [Amycolatopsis sp. 4-36]WIX98353.1 AMP-binding protein [Amycolatopsis sp. 4-36]
MRASQSRAGPSARDQHDLAVDARLLPLLRAAPAAASIGTVIVIGEPAADESVIGYEEFLSAHEPMELPDVSEESTELIMYTSGTTGRPKGVLLSHRNMQLQAIKCIRAMEMSDDSDVGFPTAPFFHIPGPGRPGAGVTPRRHLKP